MHPSQENRLNAIVSHLSGQIADDMQRLSSEERHPSGNADHMDDTIKELKERIRKLRIIREEVERTFTGTDVA